MLAAACSASPPPVTWLPPEPEAPTRKVAPPPDTPKRPVTDEYHGVSVTDEYRWLEDSADPEVQSWVRTQDQYAHNFLDRLPGREFIRSRVKAVFAAEHPRYQWLEAAPNRWFVKVHRPPAQQPVVIALAPGADPSSGTVVVDPNRLDHTGGTAIDWFVPSHGGKLFAVSMSENGSEDGAVHVFDVATGKQVGEVVPRVQYPTGGGSLAWRADDKRRGA